MRKRAAGKIVPRAIGTWVFRSETAVRLFHPDDSRERPVSRGVAVHAVVAVRIEHAATRGEQACRIGVHDRAPDYHSRVRSARHETEIVAGDFCIVNRQRHVGCRRGDRDAIVGVARDEAVADDTANNSTACAVSNDAKVVVLDRSPLDRDRGRDTAIRFDVDARNHAARSKVAMTLSMTCSLAGPDGANRIPLDVRVAFDSRTFSTRSVPCPVKLIAEMSAEPCADTSRPRSVTTSEALGRLIEIL